VIQAHKKRLVDVLYHLQYNLHGLQ